MKKEMAISGDRIIYMDALATYKIAPLMRHINETESLGCRK